MFNSSTALYSVIVYVSASWRARVKCDYNRNFVNFMLVVNFIMFKNSILHLSVTVGVEIVFW